MAYTHIRKGKFTFMENLAVFFLCFGVLISFLVTCAAVDAISANQTITDGNTIVSARENFEMGFFSPNASTNRYFGIWYNKISNGTTVVWVANKETPLNDTSGVFKLSEQGALEILSGNNSVIWSSNSSASGSSGLVAQLLDTGNLVVTEPGRFIWQSFDYPGDTLLAGMRIGVDLITGKERHLTSWKRDNDPSAGEYVFRVDPNGYPQLFKRNGTVPESRFGPWNGVTFNGMPNLGENSIFTQQFVFNENETYYEYGSSSQVFRMHLSTDGKIEQLNWVNSTQKWDVYSNVIIDDCAKSYASCGPNGKCNISSSPRCNCLEGFEPLRLEDWNKADWSGGCRRKTPLAGGNGDGFLNISGVKFPDTNTSWYDSSMTLGECEAACKRINSSCMAYASLDIRRGGSGCLLWFNDLMDIRVYEAETQQLYIKMAASELPKVPTATEHGSKKKQTITIVVSTTLGLVVVCLIIALYVTWRNKKRSRHTTQVSMQSREENSTNGSSNKDTELTAFSLSMIAKSTNNFAPNNKLGEGGFGPVYKGVLEDGREIAVKRLSATSSQGLDEFKNEVGCIAKLQHRNLVKLLGYCTQGNERMLIYEYMANKSLDFFIFDKSGSVVLDWPLRFRIINGIARGLLYLHQDSRLRIVHRDLKAGNILLDKDMNPKISDFGLARRFSGYETQANTDRVVGTYGYISPEYAVHGLFSVKSDVYSFGVLVLEIVSGKKNRGFSQGEHNDSLIGHAWKLHIEGKSLELVSASQRHLCVTSQVLRAVHIGLLCVQHHAEDRPTMSSVVLMLGNENSLPPPKQPAFFAEETLPEFNSMSSAPTVDSIDEVTITRLNPR